MSGESSISSNSSAKQKSASRVLVRLIVGHISEKLSTPTVERHTHRWTVYVKAPGFVQFTDRSFIKKVTFMLHESFKDPIRVVKDPPFEITETGYGSFIMSIKIQFNGIDKPFTINYDLNLSLIDKFCESNIEQKLELKYPSPELCALVQKYCPTKKDKETKEKVLFSKNQFSFNDKNFSKLSKMNLLKETVEKKSIQAPQKTIRKSDLHESPVSNLSKHSKSSKTSNSNITLNSTDLSSFNKSSEKSDTSSLKLTSNSSKNTSSSSSNKLNKMKTKTVVTTKIKKNDSFVDIFGSSDLKNDAKSFNKEIPDLKKQEKFSEKDLSKNKEKFKKKKFEKNANENSSKHELENFLNRQSNNCESENSKVETIDVENGSKKSNIKNITNEETMKELEKKHENLELNVADEILQKKKCKEKKSKKKKQSVSPEKLSKSNKLTLSNSIIKTEYSKLSTPNNSNEDFEERRPQSETSVAPLLTPISGLTQSPVFSTNFVKSVSKQTTQPIFNLHQTSSSELSDENEKIYPVESTSNKDEILDLEDEEDYRIFKTSQEKYRRFSNLQLAVNNISKPELLTKVLDLLMEQDQNCVITKNNFKTVNFNLISLKRQTFLALENLIYYFKPSVNWWENLLIDHNKRKNTLRNN